MRPFPYRQSRLNPRKENYNIRLCKVRRVVENAFAMLVQKWRIFFRRIATKFETTILIVKAACVLHNFLRAKQCDSQYCELQPPDQPSQQSAFTYRFLLIPHQFVPTLYPSSSRFCSLRAISHIKLGIFSLIQLIFP